MTSKNIITHLCLKYPPEIIHSITTENILIEIVRRMGDEALELSAEDLELVFATLWFFLLDISLTL